jgi:PTS system N-acetylglucosamine-specific IIC component
MLASIALTSFLTGVTEPVEFAFMFLAPALFAAHVLLTGLAFVVMDRLGVKLGYSFSAGLIDFLINLRLSTRPWLLAPVGAVYGLLYYAVFRWAIARFDLKTPGRAATEAVVAPGPADRGGAWLAALGGPANLTALSACTTRLRLTVARQAAVDEAALRRLGAKGLVRPSAATLQVIIGPQADLVATEIDAARARAASAQPETAAQALLSALGGRAALAEVKAVSTRLLVRLAADPGPGIEARLTAAGVRALARPADNRLHLIVGPRLALATQLLVDGAAQGLGEEDL